jgi:hypothetical protein
MARQPPYDSATHHYTHALDRSLTLEDRKAVIDLSPCTLCCAVLRRLCLLSLFCPALLCSASQHTTVMNRSPFTVHHEFWSIFAYRLFRSMGLRHLPVVDDEDQVCGMITRKDLIEPVVRARFEEITMMRRGMCARSLLFSAHVTNASLFLHVCGRIKKVAICCAALCCKLFYFSKSDCIASVQTPTLRCCFRSRFFWFDFLILLHSHSYRCFWLLFQLYECLRFE